MSFNISSNFYTSATPNVGVNKGAKKCANLAPLNKDTISFCGKNGGDLAEKVFRQILFGDVESAKELFLSSNKNSTEDDFQEFYSKSLREFFSTPKEIAKAEDIEYDSVEESENADRKSKYFYKDGKLVREIRVLTRYKDIVVDDYMGHDKDSGSFIKIQRRFDDRGPYAIEVRFKEDRQNLTYKNVYHILNDDGEFETDVEFDENALKLRDKIEETIPKYTESRKLEKPDASTHLPKYLYHLTTEENYKKMKSDGKIMAGNNRDIKGVYCIDAENFKNFWGEHEAWKGNLKEGLIFKRILNKKTSDNLVILRIPTEKLDNSKIRVRTEEDYFYANSLYRNSSLIGAEAPKCVSEGYDWATGVKNFKDTNALEFIVQENIDIDDAEVVYIGRPEEGNLEEVMSALETEPEAKPETPLSKFGKFFKAYKQIFE